MWFFFSCNTYLKAIWTRCARTSWASSVTRLRSLSCLMKLSSSEALAIQKARAPAMFFCFCKRDGVLSTARERSHEGQERGSHSHKKQQQSQDRLEPLSDPPSLPHNQTPPADRPTGAQIYAPQGCAAFSFSHTSSIENFIESFPFSVWERRSTLRENKTRAPPSVETH